MSVRGGPELKRYMDKRLSVKLSASRNVIGVLRGYDNFMNLVLADTVEVVSATERNTIGTVVLRGSSIIQMECLDRLAVRME